MLQGKRAWITGASSGIGAATARKLAESGVSLILSARREERLRALAAELSAQVPVQVMPLDIANREQVADAGLQMLADGAVDILINNAGTMPISPVLAGRVDEWEQMIDVNLKGVLYAIHAVYPAMVEQTAGHIINISSVAARQTYPSAAVYAATKHAVRAVSEGLRKEARRYQVRVTDIQPGAVDTELPDSIRQEKIREAVKANMYAADTKILTPEDIANAIIYALEQPAHVDVSELQVMPVIQES